MHAYIYARLLCNGESEGAIKSEIYEIEKLDGQLLLHVEGHIGIWVSFRSRGEHLVMSQEEQYYQPQRESQGKKATRGRSRHTRFKKPSACK